MAVASSKDVVAEPVIEAEHAMIAEHPTVKVEVTPLPMDTEVSQELVVCVEQGLVELVVSEVDSVLDLVFDVTESVLEPVGLSVVLELSGGPGCVGGQRDGYGNPVSHEGWDIESPVSKSR